MMSPDGKYFWDGQKWVAVASASDAGHRSVFPSWNEIHVTVADQPVAPLPVAVQARPAPAIQYGPPSTDVPLWERAPKSKMSYGMYVAGGLLAVLVLFGLISAWGPLIASYFVAAPEPPRAATPSPTPPPLSVRSDYARADRFFTYQVTPAMSKVWPALQLFNETCVNITSSCQNAAVAALAQVKGVESMIDHAQIPSCIATQVARVRGELTGMDAAITLAVKAFADNKKTELSTAVSRYKTASKTLGADIAAISKAATARCDTQATGP